METEDMKNPYQLAGTILEKAAADQDTADMSAFTSIDLYGSAVQPQTDVTDTCRSFHLENESGDGDITLYSVFPGIELVYNDMHMAYCNRNQQPASEVMEINYCKAGAGNGAGRPFGRR